MQSAKGVLRTRAQMEREHYYNALSEPQKREITQKILTHFKSSFAFQKTDVIAGFWPISSEIDPRPFLIYLHEAGHKLALPVTTSKSTSLQFRQWKPNDAMADGAFGISEPLPSAALVEPTVLILPMLAFDNHGNRLGYGAGHYDRTIFSLQKKRQVMCIGLAYEMQRVNELPHASHDQLLNFVVTEEKVYAFTKK